LADVANPIKPYITSVASHPRYCIRPARLKADVQYFHDIVEATDFYVQTSR